MIVRLVMLVVIVRVVVGRLIALISSPVALAKRLRGSELVDRDEWPAHQPGPAWEAPIPGTHWYAGCDPDGPRVNPATGRCEGCGELACTTCGRSNCPDHGA